MEKHAAKIYTRTMFEKFQDFLYKSGSYYVDEVVLEERYVAKHFDSETREKWCKVEFEISVINGYYTCECGMYERMGMLCCHVLKVLFHLRFTEIPAARDVLPLHLKQYQKDQGLMTSFSFRHSQLYLNCSSRDRRYETTSNRTRFCTRYVGCLGTKAQPVRTYLQGPRKPRKEAKCSKCGLVIVRQAVFRKT